LSGLAIDADDNLYVTQCPGSPFTEPAIFNVDPFGLLQVYAFAVGGQGFGGDGGLANAALVDCQVGVAVDKDGNLFVADLGNNRIRRIDRNGFISTVAGSSPPRLDHNTPVSLLTLAGSFAGDGGPATSARLWGPVAVALDPAGHLFIADSNNSRVRKVDEHGIISTVAGTGVEGSGGDGGPATAAQLDEAGNGSDWLAFDA
jgi:hypothetical protein